MTISAIIITFNEENFIEKCLLSLQGIADEIIVVDSFSTDRTEEICRKFNLTFNSHRFEGYVEQKNFALTLSRYRYVLSLDADEALSDELRNSILTVKQNLEFDGYYFNRLNNYCGRWIRNSRMYPDRHLRLFDKTKGKWTGPNPHDKFKLIKGSKTTRLKGDLLHWNYDSVEEHLKKIEYYSSISAEEYFREGRQAGRFTAHLHMYWSFFRSYFLYAGFLDGKEGYDACRIMARERYLKYVKLRELIIRNTFTTTDV
jgi:glycosyltransferase involved in cell wall biosynthesis